MLVPIVPKIWITIEGDKLRIIEDGTMELVLEKEKHPDKQFIEIATVEGDIAALVNLAIKSYIEKAIKETNKNSHKEAQEAHSFRGGRNAPLTPPSFNDIIKSR